MSGSTANFADAAATEFPFLLLHSELVRYFSESDEQRSVERSKWLAEVDKSKISELSEDAKLAARQLFSQV